MNKLVILDRDGVVNFDSDEYVKSVDEWLPIPGSIDAIARLDKAGFQIAIATNQSGVGRGYYDEQALQAMNRKMLDLVAAAGGTIHAIAFCPHLPDAGCDCRKPAPGMIYQIEKMLDRTAAEAYFVGDSIRDLEAARTAGCIPILVTTGKGAKTIAKLPETEFADTPVFADLATFVDHLLAS